MTGPKKLFTILFSFTLFCSYSQTDPFNYSIQKKAVCSNGAVVSAHPLASKAGIDILKKGGNAIDAAIASQLVLAVVYPGAGNIGGGGFMVAHLHNGKNITLDYREMAPLHAGRNMYLDSNGNAQLNLSQNGHLAAGIPGTIAGLFASMKYATLPFARLIQPAIDLAEKGFVITQAQANSLNENRTAFLRYNSSPIAFVKERPWKSGDTLIQPELAGTLKRIQLNGVKEFYEGPTAKMMAEEMKRGNGIITMDDLRTYTVKERPPVTFTYKGNEIVSMPLPSSGGILLQQMLRMIENRNIAGMRFQTLQSVQLMTEAERRAYADRAKYLGDADFVQVPVKTLVSKKYLSGRMKDYDPSKAGNSTDTKAGIIPESEETTHLCVYDRYGNAVSVTTTLNGSFGSKVVVTGAGFLLNNEMDDFSIKPGVPNMYGAVGAEANAIAPGKRMLSSMTPVIVLKKQQPYIITGTPGGTTIPTSVFQTIVNLIEFRMSAEDAVNKPKFHHQWLPDVIYTENDFDTETAKKLALIGYIVQTRGYIGRTELIEIKKINYKKHITVIGDKRGDDAAEGY